MTRRVTGTTHSLAWAALIGALALAGRPASALAKSERVTEYSYEQIWPTAVRLLRVDAGYKILEKDAEAGYVLFEASEEGKTFRGSLELVKLEGESGRKSVRMILNIEDRPSYVETGLLDRLERKLRDEYGVARQAPPSDEHRE